MRLRTGLGLVLYMAISGCLQPSLYGPIAFSAEEKAETYQELTRRFALWHGEVLGGPIPPLPSVEALFAEARVYEFVSTPNSTCYFDAPDLIKIGDDKWASGCVPHEFGHLALYMMKHPCWREFEHASEVAKCRSRS